MAKAHEKALKLAVRHADTSKDEARLKASKTTKRGVTRFGGKGSF